MDRSSPSRDIRLVADEAGLGEFEWTWWRLQPLLSRRRPPLLWVFDGGLVVNALQENRVDVYPWAKCHLKYTKDYLVSYGGTTVVLSILLLHEDGPLFRARKYVSRDDPVLERLIAGVTEAQLPRARAALDRGERLDFGWIQIDRHEMHYRGRSVSWNDIFDVGKVWGRIVVRRRGRIPSCLLRASDTLDVHVLLGVAEELSRG